VPSRFPPGLAGFPESPPPVVDRDLLVPKLGGVYPARARGALAPSRIQRKWKAFRWRLGPSQPRVV